MQQFPFPISQLLHCFTDGIINGSVDVNILNDSVVIGNFFHFCLLTVIVIDLVTGNTDEPGPEGFFTVKGIKAAESPDICLLQDIFGIL